MRSLALLLFLGLFVAACSNGDSNTDNNANGESGSETTSAPSTKYQLTPFEPSTAFEDAAITQMTYINDTWDFKIEGSSYQLGVQTPDADQKMCANSDKGQHIHLIFDNKPYKAKYTSTFSDEIMAPGDYHVLAFLSRSYHESIKTPEAHKAQIMTIGDGKYMKRAESINFPMLFYSRPKGTYIGKKNTDKVMLDFYVVNAQLGEGKYSVKAEINGEEEHILEAWQPYYIEGLPMGKNTITLTLLDPKGQIVDAPFNPVTREFELKADALE